MTTTQFTVQQIVRRIGLRKLCAQLGLSQDAPRKWYTEGIPGRHWIKLVSAHDWLDYEMLVTATLLAQRRKKRRRAA